MNIVYKYPLLFILLCLLLARSQTILALNLSDNIQLHGFLTQGAFYTSDNNYNGQSDDSISFDQTEIGLNLHWQASDKIDFAGQALFRRAGEVDNGSIRLDYGLVNFNLFNNQNSHFGLRLGRIKNPLGLYNETRDMAFTTPSILLPQSIYIDRSRSLLLSSDGAQFYADKQVGMGWLSVKLNYGLMQNDNDEILKQIFGPMAQGKLEAGNAEFAGQIRYNIDSDKYVFAISYADVTLNYQPQAYDLIADGSARFSPFIFSTQYNGEKISLTAEYYYSKNKFKDFGSFVPDYSPISTNWYIQGAYRLAYNWQASLRYDVNYLNKDDKTGANYQQVGLPNHMGFTKDWMLALRWDINPSMMLRAEYHYLNGTSWITSADNPDRSVTQQYWDMVAVQFSYRF